MAAQEHSCKHYFTIRRSRRSCSSQPQQQRESPQVLSTCFAHVEIPVRSSGFCPEPVVDAFSKCVSGLLSVVVQDLKIQIGFSHGSNPAEISAIYSCHVRPTVMNSSYILVGDLYAEVEREYMVEMKVPISSTAVVGSHSHHHMFSVRCSYKDLATQELTLQNYFFTHVILTHIFCGYIARAFQILYLTEKIDGNCQ
ncbi:von Willebrand factor [Forsythia ovata]|uniref:von Willebrand factor n=1 Tax=Forsythia ovata TaxID=205694 RepID=A0ABD1T9H2_9LAMI